MTTINVRVDESLKRQSFDVLKELGVTPSELFRMTLQYVIQNKQLPVKARVLTPEDEALIATVKERLKAPQRVKVSLDEL